MPFDAMPQIDTDTTTDLAILRTARNAIAAPGAWCQTLWDDNDGKRCALGWLEAAAHSTRSQENFGTLMRRLLVPALPIAWRRATANSQPSNQLAWFNDTPGQTQARMVQLFDDAIARAEQRA